jgi:hypothetical protein
MDIWSLLSEKPPVVVRRCGLAEGEFCKIVLCADPAHAGLRYLPIQTHILVEGHQTDVIEGGVHRSVFDLT